MYVSDRMLWLSDKRSRIQGYIYYNQYLISTGQPEKIQIYSTIYLIAMLMKKTNFANFF